MTLPIADASVLLGALLATVDTPECLALLRRTQVRVPDIMQAETRSVLRALYQQGEIDHPDLIRVEKRINAMPFDTVSSDPHLEQAYLLAVQLSEPIYSCIYLALALATNSILFTVDQQFVRSAQRVHRLSRSVRHVSEPL